MERWDALIIGGGFYGLYLAEFLASRLRRVLLCERGDEPMRRASYGNQARVHNGYHYPRSVLTALRSRVNFPRFVEEFRPAVRTDFEKIYAIPRQGSKVTAEQFAESMKRIGAPIAPAKDDVKELFDRALIEEVFQVREYAFDSTVLRRLMLERIRRAGVELRVNTDVRRIESRPGGSIGIDLASEGCQSPVAARVMAGMVVNCTYSQTNAVAAASGIPLIPLKHEQAEMALVEVPAKLQGLGITVMDGPFFSCMPFPPRGLYTLSHVRYTPHGHWFDDGEQPHRPAYEMFDAAEKRSAYSHMIRDAARYLPALAKCEYRDSLWEVKTVLPRSESDDSRPILFRPHHGIPNYHVVMGGKIDNVYDVADEMAKALGWNTVLPLAA
ncbi:MAG TPA: FAD-dependent oxidoreductase [Urbifossiella sp.]|jgi:glycine/D-amino acid oxidase-like deaminating enzyme